MLEIMVMNDGFNVETTEGSGIHARSHRVFEQCSCKQRGTIVHIELKTRNVSQYRSGNTHWIYDVTMNLPKIREEF